MTIKEMDMLAEKAGLKIRKRSADCSPARGSVRWWIVKRTIEEEYCVSAPDAETAKSHAAHFEIPSKVVVLNATAIPYKEEAPNKDSATNR